MGKSPSGKYIAINIASIYYSLFMSDKLTTSTINFLLIPFSSGPVHDAYLLALFSMYQFNIITLINRIHVLF